ncbi:hypothetical protein [Vreelandella neptunia]|uniref:Uncharacterized protein n=1 Tax=Vreelandella neptunia TaxID=115551 RepID=A0ABS9S7K8_9GAMM|nr:hypothetical protein [Halomonas neptunia]MCH4812097.1 hypothetical protein [Halomonas neptunia]
MNKQFVANVTPKEQSIERMVAIIIEELKPAVGAMVDEKLKEAGVGGSAKPDMAANLASKYTLPGSEFEAPDSEAPRASNGRKMPSLMDGYQLPD